MTDFQFNIADTFLTERVLQLKWTYGRDTNTTMKETLTQLGTLLVPSLYPSDRQTIWFDCQRIGTRKCSVH